MVSVSRSLSKAVQVRCTSGTYFSLLKVSYKMFFTQVQYLIHNSLFVHMPVTL